MEKDDVELIQRVLSGDETAQGKKIPKRRECRISI